MIADRGAAIVGYEGAIAYREVVIAYRSGVIDSYGSVIVGYQGAIVSYRNVILVPWLCLGIARGGSAAKREAEPMRGIPGRSLGMSIAMYGADY